MFAVFYEKDNVIGYKEIEYEGEEETFQLSYDLVEVIPDILANLEEGYKYIREEEGVYSSVEIVIAPPELTPEQIELADLKQRTEDLEILLAEIITGG